MMDYKLFKSVIVNRIVEYLPPIYSDFTPEIECIRKVNEVKDALILRPGNANSIKALPMIYLDDMYKEFEGTEDLESILTEISNVIVNYTGYYPNEIVDIDFSALKDKIILNLVSADINCELLKNIPHIKLVNMAIIFRVMVGQEENGFNSVIVNNKIMDELDMTTQEIFVKAKENTRKLFPEKVIELDEGVIVLSNKYGMFGANMMLYDDVMRDVGKRIGEDEFFVVPSSIHELILVSESVADAEKLIHMLAEGNRDVTLDRDILSNTIYKYSCVSAEFRKVASYKKAELA